MLLAVPHLICLARICKFVQFLNVFVHIGKPWQSHPSFEKYLADYMCDCSDHFVAVLRVERSVSSHLGWKNFLFYFPRAVLFSKGSRFKVFFSVLQKVTHSPKAPSEECSIMPIKLENEI